jgi:tRNA(Met) cytidine acetyltransferase
MKLLALAHYRTEPDYLLTILEGEHHRIHMLECGGLVAAADTSVEEWRSDIDEAARISLKMLWLQTLKEPNVRAVRVVRIAVHPQLQRRGYGSKLLQHIEEWASTIGADLVTAMFGRHDVIGFWAKNGYKLYYISPRYNRATGEKNLAFAKPLTKRGAELLEEASSKMRAKLLLAAHMVYRDVAAEKLAKLLRLTTPTTIRLELGDLSGIRAYLSGVVEHEQVFDSIYLLVLHKLAKGCERILDDKMLILLVAHILQGKPLGEAAELAGLTLEDAVDKLRYTVKTLLENC